MTSGFLSGYKTYVVAGVMVLYGAAMYAVGDMTLQEAIMFVLNGGGLAALRAGIAKV